MGADHDALREQLGTVGAWTFAFDTMTIAQVRAAAVEIESLGYGALWVPEGSSSRDIFAHLSILLDATDRITVASGIANITARQPEVMAAGFRTLADAEPDRLVAGVGIGHEYSTQSRGIDWNRPLSRMRTYLDRMDAAAAVPAPTEPRRLLAALGDGMLRLSAARALGAHTYFVPVSHTARARAVLGPEPVLAVEQGVVLGGDRSRALRIAQEWADGYLDLPNYANNLRRLGFSDDDVAGGGSEGLIDATFAVGDVDVVAARVYEHLEAGADHVCIQIISDSDSDSDSGSDACMPQLRSLAAALVGASPPRVRPGA
ncbi:MAG: TIGR03620 family F420-dependent LLM class oxidoreductase [Actinomycetota bacterium]